MAKWNPLSGRCFAQRSWRRWASPRRCEAHAAGGPLIAAYARPPSSPWTWRGGQGRSRRQSCWGHPQTLRWCIPQRQPCWRGSRTLLCRWGTEASGTARSRAVLSPSPCRRTRCRRAAGWALRLMPISSRSKGEVAEIEVTMGFSLCGAGAGRSASTPSSVAALTAGSVLWRRRSARRCGGGSFSSTQS